LRHVVFLALAFAVCAEAQEMVTLQTRPGVTQSFLIAAMDGRAPQAAALLFPGGGGAINLRMEGGRPKFGTGNFLVRARGEFIRNGVLPVILDAPSDHAREMPDHFRAGEAHRQDVRAVLAEMRKRYPHLPLFLVGTSRGTLSVAYLAAPLGGQVAGAVQTSTFFYGPGRVRPAALSSFDWSTIKVPLLFVHHADDNCGATPYLEARRLEQRFALVTVHGGKPPESPACEPQGPHRFNGQDAETGDPIARWMLKKPFAKEIR
jgi:predicted alpha/beta-hydrolase family hydrolase